MTPQAKKDLLISGIVMLALSAVLFVFFLITHSLSENWTLCAGMVFVSLLAMAHTGPIKFLNPLKTSVKKLIYYICFFIVIASAASYFGALKYSYNTGADPDFAARICVLVGSIGLVMLVVFRHYKEEWTKKE